MRWSELSRARRVAALLCLLSFAGWSAWELLRPARTPFMDLSGAFTDHFSHMNTARVFPLFGADVWRKSPSQLLSRPTPAEAARLPPDVFRCRDCLFVRAGWKKPVLLTWPDTPRFYPPGDLLLTAPIAALYHFTALSATGANRLLLVLFLACTHLAFFILLDAVLAAPDGLRWHALLPTFLGASALLHWTLEGFYDGCIAVPLLLSWRYLGERRGLAAAVAFCAAAFLSYRAFFYAPWVLAAAVVMLREEELRRWAKRDWIAASTGVLLGASSLYSFAVSLPSLRAFNNPRFLPSTVNDYRSPLFVSSIFPVNHGVLFAGALVAAVALVAFLAARAWLDAAMLAWLAFALTTIRQTAPWYLLAEVPWLCAVPRAGVRERAPVVWSARALVFLFLSIAVHADARYGIDAVPTWLAQLSF